MTENTTNNTTTNKTNAVQNNNDVLEMLNLIAQTLNDQSTGIDNANAVINTVGRESLELHKSNENTNELLNHHADLLDTLVKSQEKLEKNNEDAAKTLTSTNQTTKDLITAVDGMRNDISEKVKTLSDNHNETVKSLNKLSENNNQTIYQTMKSLASVKEAIAKLDHAKDLAEIKKSLADLINTLIASDKQSKATDNNFNTEFAKIQDSFVKAIQQTNVSSEKAHTLTQRMDNIDGTLDKIELQLTAICKSANIQVNQDELRKDLKPAKTKEAELKEDVKEVKEAKENNDSTNK